MAVTEGDIVLPDKDTAVYKCAKCGEKVKIENDGTKYSSFEGRCILLERSCEKCEEALELQGIIPSKGTIELLNKDKPWQ
jgi:DNA-directed RNA polymerase subunit RPC12/RpoP